MSKVNPENPAPTSWPIAWYLLAMIVAAVALQITVPLDGAGPNRARLLGHAVILTTLVARLLIAVLRRERNREWIIWIAIALLAAPVWLLVETVS
jgi:nicotinamide riboside transporter PnuC